MSDLFSSACLRLCEWTVSLGPGGSSRQVGSRRHSTRCGGSYIVTTRATGPFEGQHSKMDHHFSFTMKCLHCYASQVARLGWPASAMHLACIQPIR